MVVGQLHQRVLVAALLLLAAGCNATGGNRKVATPPTAEELALAAEVEKHRAAYYRHLLTLHDFYASNGFETKRRWAKFELEQLDKVQTYAYATDATASSTARAAQAP